MSFGSNTARRPASTTSATSFITSVERPFEVEASRPLTSIVVNSQVLLPPVVKLGPEHDHKCFLSNAYLQGAYIDHGNWVLRPLSFLHDSKDEAVWAWEIKGVSSRADFICELEHVED